MELEFKTALIQNTTEDEVKAEMAKIAAEGWQTRPDVPAVTVIHLIRVKGAQPAASGFANAEMRIDEDKVLIRSAVDGKLRKADGTIVPEN